jgi:CRP/FNR family cyclic AMP-dependent transcriptional regulator
VYDLEVVGPTLCPASSAVVAFGPVPATTICEHTIPILPVTCEPGQRPRGAATSASDPAPIDPAPEPLAGTDLEHVLAGASPQTLAALSLVARTSWFSARDSLVRQGDELRVTVLLDGWVAVRRTSPEGRVFTLFLMRPGHVLGLGSVSRPGRSTFDLVALTSGRISTLPGADVRHLAEQDATLAVRLFDLDVGRSELIAHRLDEATFDHARKRLATILLSYEQLVTAASPIVSRADLAGLIGASREMLGSVIRALEAEGIISREGRRIAIRDRARLEREADWAGAGGEHAHSLLVLADRQEARDLAAPRSAG